MVIGRSVIRRVVGSGWTGSASVGRYPSCLRLCIL